MVSFTGWAGQEIGPGDSGQVSSFECSTSSRAQECCSTWASTPLQTIPPQFLTGTKGRQGCQSRYEGGQVCCGSLASGNMNSLWSCQSCTFFAISSTVSAFFAWPGPGFFWVRETLAPFLTAASMCHILRTTQQGRISFPRGHADSFFTVCVYLCAH